ncbi:two-component system, OmpR family, response regulator RegX3 [Ruminococcus flavefaciens]|uniref:Stage 0 sporulation protein A homolog n=1 Tax=Ruminococcus flavefaciens TaxID=1265 RepID=A0A1H6K802_RUMFL|nr:response regulator transcription factor [Ruminococcus flavefaciens]SEH69166.1 two-component system, OmpR family, response regulator RegX3 [Ruminococcus flavefaciens]
MKYQCLMIDDDVTIAETTAEYFNIFDISTAYVTSFEDAVKFLEENQVSLLLLDINLGERSGFELCKQVRAQYDMPILFISARTSDDDVLTALNIGGDDYIKKPYTLNILLAKVKAILKRYERSAEAAVAVSAKAVSSGDTMKQREVVIKDGLVLDTGRRKLIKNGAEVSLKAMEYKMLVYLLEKRGFVVTKDEFLKNVWGDEFIGEGTLAVHIRHLREKIESDPNSPDIIKTVWGVGYIIEDGEAGQEA